ncbi:helix-turn-helix transcriptional regulator [Helicobacter mehlei]|uniref:helix-turn-helix transcriptional regulator n=1 Tax=Helicobacter mehlei TaxID=2316080 RepID=UPI000EAFC2A5|nr:helix-turn-helix domain-containing protein [Helicobacter mehlei]
MADELLKAREVADILKVHIRTLYHWRVIGKPPKAVKVNGRYYYPRSELDKYINAKDDNAN